MWECFVETQSQLFRSGRRKTCILFRVPEWKDNEFPCFKCGKGMESGIFMHKGFPICEVCMKRKKKQITKGILFIYLYYSTFYLILIR